MLTPKLLTSTLVIYLWTSMLNGYTLWTLISREVSPLTLTLEWSTTLYISSLISPLVLFGKLDVNSSYLGSCSTWLTNEKYNSGIQYQIIGIISKKKEALFCYKL